MLCQAYVLAQLLAVLDGAAVESADVEPCRALAGHIVTIERPGNCLQSEVCGAHELLVVANVQGYRRSIALRRKPVS